MPGIVGSIITDCADSLARSRQELRFKTLFGVHPSFLGVGSYSPIEAAGTLMDQLDVLINFPNRDETVENIVLVNIAPRGEDIKEKWDNGTPFCYFRIGRTLVASTYEGHCLAIARDMGLVDQVELFDIPTVTTAAVEWGDLTPEQADKINNTQFRSLEFLPLVTAWVWEGKPVPSTKRSLGELPSAHGIVWHIDNFDNIKTTLLPEDVGFEQGKEVKLSNGNVAVCYNRLADVPKDVTGLTIGSSGYGKHRFLELAIGHRGKAATFHGFNIGDTVLGR